MTKFHFEMEICWIRVDKFGEYKYKKKLDDDAQWKSVKLKVVAPTEDVMPVLKPAIKCPIDGKKLADSKKLLTYVPLTFHDFYNNLSAKIKQQQQITASDIDSASESENDGEESIFKVCFY